MSLSKHDLNSLRRSLEAKRAALLGMHARNIIGGIRSEEAQYPDPMDAATRSETESELLGLADQERRLITEIDRALSKMKAGTYGKSELSDEPIALDRLRAVPWARLTAEEEELRVRRGER